MQGVGGNCGRVGALLFALALCAALTAAAATASPPVRIAGPGQGAGQVERPSGIAVDRSSGDLYVADTNNLRIDKFDAEGNFLLAWGFAVADNESAELQTCGPQASPEPTLKCFRSPTAAVNTDPGPGNVLPESVAVDNDPESPSYGDVYVADSSKRRVTEFTPDGEFVLMIGKEVNPGSAEPDICTAADVSEGDECGVGEEGADPEEEEFFDTPVSVFVDSSGHLWVGDAARVIQFDPEGHNLSQAAVPGGGGAVRGLGIDAESGHLCLKGGLAAAVQCYEPSGSPVDELIPVGPPIDEAGDPRALVLGSEGSLYVGDRTDPYRFLRFEEGVLTSLFGEGRVIGAPGGVQGGNPLALDEARGFLYAASSRGAGLSAVQRFTLPEEGPLPEEPRAEEILPTTATLKGTVNPEGQATEWRFEYGPTAAYGAETPLAALAGSEYETEQVSAPLAGLLPDTTYHLRLTASSHCREEEPEYECTTHSEDTTFTTPTAVGIDAQWTDGVSAGAAGFHAELDPLGAPAEWRLEYGTTTAYANHTEFQPLGSGIGAVTVSRRISDLAPDTLYHYRFVARSERDPATCEAPGEPCEVLGPDRTVLSAPGALGFSLPDGRAWEQVSPLRKGGGRIVPPWVAFGGTRSSEDGDALAFQSVGPVSEAEGNRFPETSQSLARRGPGGWSSEAVDPPHETSQPTAGSEYKLFSLDLARAALEPRGLRRTRPGPLSPEASEWTPYLRENFAEPARWRPLVTGKEPFANVCPADTRFGGEEGRQLYRNALPLYVLGGSPDLGSVVFESAAPLICDPEGVESEGVRGATYKWSEGELELVSRLPGSGGEEGEATGATLGSSGPQEGSTRGAVSEGGRYVYWSHAAGLYVRDTAAERTVRLDVPLAHSIGGEDRPIFQGASADGTRAFFTDTRHLTPDAGDEGADLYECELVGSGGGEECALRDLTPETASRESADVQGTVSAIDEDGSDLYFAANGALTPGAVSGDCAFPSAASQRCNLYHAHREGDSWELELVAVLSGEDWPDWGRSGNQSNTANLAAAASPSGRYLAFMSELPLSGYDNRDARSGERAEEVFRYDSASGSLACVSCNPSGARPRGAVGGDGYQLATDGQGLWSGRLLAATLPDPQNTELSAPASYHPRAMLDNGRVLFNAFDSLVPADSNGAADAYEYEPWGAGGCTSASRGPALSQAQGGGCVALLSSGTSERESAVLDSSASGDDVFIITASQLSPLDEDPDYDVYDARVGGVAATREALSECLGEACQAPAAPPEPQIFGSAAFRGPGNPRAKEGRCAGPARRARKLAGRAKRLRREARRRAGRDRPKARALRRRAARNAARAKRRSRKARRCRSRLAKARRGGGSSKSARRANRGSRR